MELDLSKYKTARLLASYEFIFPQWLAGEISQDQLDKDLPTTYIMSEIITEIRKQYLAREDADLEALRKVEKTIMKNLTQIFSLSDEQLKHLYEELSMKAWKTVEEIRKS